MGKLGFFKVFYEGDVGFWSKNGTLWVNLQGLGKIGKAETFENVRKRLKNDVKRLKNDVKRLKIFENVRVLNKNEQRMCAFLQLFFSHEGTKKEDYYV